MVGEACEIPIAAGENCCFATQFAALLDAIQYAQPSVTKVGGVTEFLERHRDVPMGVATNGERANLDFVLDTAGLRRYFRVVMDGNAVRRPKPDPEIYLRVAEQLRREPQN